MYTECKVETCGNPIFALGLCRKHYEQERLATAAPCSFSGCQKKAYRGDLCSTHYRAHINSTHPTCIVPGCTSYQKTLSSGLCERHLFRSSRHGTVEQPRQSDWGSREQHPLYDTYHWHRRKGDMAMCQEWRDDFWKMVEVIKERPEGHSLRKHNKNEPLGPNNWYWKEPFPSKNGAMCSREWRKRNPEGAKNIDLKKHYGITLEQYKAMSIAQNGVCGVCGKPESSKDKDGGPRMMPVDHCHKTGKIRGLLCAMCNKALGAFNDDPLVLQEAINYLHRTA